MLTDNGRGNRMLVWRKIKITFFLKSGLFHTVFLNQLHHPVSDFRQQLWKMINQPSTCAPIKSTKPRRHTSVHTEILLPPWR